MASPLFAGQFEIWIDPRIGPVTTLDANAITITLHITLLPIVGKFDAIYI